jgi:hypothetical protein
MKSGARQRKLSAKSRQGKSGEIPNETLQLLIEASHDHQESTVREPAFFQQ